MYSFAPLVMPAVLLILSISMMPVALAQTPAPPGEPPSGFGPHPISVGLPTVVDHPAEFARHLVRLAPAEVRRILAPTLIEVRDPERHGNYAFYAPNRHDRLLVLLPSTVKVSQGDWLVVTGAVRVLGGARLSGEAGGIADDLARRRRNETLVIAETVSTVDRTSLVPRR